MVIGFIKDILKRLKDLEDRVDNIEKNLAEIEGRLTRFGKYEKRTIEELALMKGMVEDSLKSIESLIEREENKDNIKKAINLRTRLKNNQTRINKAMNA